jgi:protein involved in polysaccharide export with SLBB domain
MSIIDLCKRTARWAAVCGLLAAGFLLAGCHSPSSKQGFSDTPGAASGPAINPENEVFHPGEAATIIFTDLPTPVPAYDVKIKEDGTVTLLLNQAFTFAGKTRGAVEQEIRDRYVPRFFKYMTVTIKWEQATLFYYVDGEVKAPARQTYIERTTVLKAIASAGGFTDFAKKSAVTVTRRDGRKFTINCKKARVHPELDLEVYSGDKVYVPRKLW